MPSFGFINNMGLLESIRENAIGVAMALVAILTFGVYIFKRIRSRVLIHLRASCMVYYGCLDPKKFKEFRLIKKTSISPNSAIFKFALPTPTSVLGLPMGHCIICRGKDRDGEEVTRSYTPITLDSDLGYFELVGKMYPKGKMSHHFGEMRAGDCLPVQGPKLTCAILENPKDKTKVHLICANATVADIILKDELDTLANAFPDRFKVYYVLNQPPKIWNGGVGYVTKKMIRTRCPPPASDIKILRCGPPPPMNRAMAAHLSELNYTEDMQFEF